MSAYRPINTKIDPGLILMVDDDRDDQMLMMEAVSEADISCRIDFVENGEQLLDYLERKNRFSNQRQCDYPGLILLDLNMPRKNGHTALKELRDDARFRRIAIVIFSTSDAPEQIKESYDLGANAYVRKPQSFSELTEVVQHLIPFWQKVAKLSSHLPAEVGEIAPDSRIADPSATPKRIRAKHAANNDPVNS